MKLFRFRDKGRDEYGFLRKETLISVPKLSALLNESAPADMDGLIALGREAIATINALVEKARPAEIQQASCSISDVGILAPLAAPPKILCLGVNYRSHAAEKGGAVPEEPVLFMKPRTAIIGDGEAIIKPEATAQLDYEGELAVIMAQKGRNIPADHALSYVFGYTIMNDVSARDLQAKDKQFTRAKGFDTFAPLGPCVVTADEIPDPSKLAIRTWVNGELRQDARASDMAFSVPETIAYISRVMTLEPGDIISTGTPAGVGLYQRPKPVFLQKGDKIQIEIDAIGRLQNTVQ